MLCERNDLLVRGCVDGCDAAAGGGGDATGDGVQNKQQHHECRGLSVLISSPATDDVGVGRNIYYICMRMTLEFFSRQFT
jgi:hypothetical protein